MYCTLWIKFAIIGQPKPKPQLQAWTKPTGLKGCPHLLLPFFLTNQKLIEGAVWDESDENRKRRTANFKLDQNMHSHTGAQNVHTPTFQKKWPSETNLIKEKMENAHVW